MIDGVTDVLLLGVVIELCALQLLLVARWTQSLTLWLMWVPVYLVPVGLVVALVTG